MNILLGKQSILDRQQQVIGYELLFRSVEPVTSISDTNATANVVSNMLSMFHSEHILGDKKGFINIGIEMLKMDLLSILAPEEIVIEILETQEPSKEMVELIQKLKRKNYIFALDDFICTQEQIDYWTPVLQEVDIVKIDVIDTTITDLTKNIKSLQKFNVKLLAEKVETQEMFDLCMELEFDYFQGFFFTIPVIVKGQALSLNMQGILEIYDLFQNDADIPLIEDSVKKYSDISISLLKLVNSSSIGPVQKITAIKQTIALLGKKAISKWLLLILYSQNHGNTEQYLTTADPIFLSASQRAKMAELIIKKHPNTNYHKLAEEGFLTGLLSLAPVVLKIPMEDVLKQLCVSEAISNAIINKSGILGDILSLIIAYEQKDYDNLYALCYKLKISIKDINDSMLIAWKFSSQIASN
ncbi:MAG: EAL and HDOD domain-containing protein [Brevinema sp.]